MRELTTQPPRSHSEECLLAVEQVLEYRFPYMAGRGARVAALSRAIAAHLRPAVDDYVLGLAARFHDLGMLAIPDGVMFKREKLTPAELTSIRQHPAIGAKLFSRLFPDLPAAAAAIIYHHERPDGGGIYALRADKIPPTVGIIAVAGAIEAMANDRPHRPAVPPARIADELRHGRAVQFLAEVVDAVLPHLAHILPLATDATMTKSSHPPTPQPAQTTVAPAVVPPPPRPATITAPAPAPPAPTHPLPDIAPLTREQSFKRLEQAMASRTPSPVGARVVSLAASSGAEVNDLANVIATDPVLAARVLDVANSAAYGANRRLTTSIADAVRNVGLSTVRNIALALAVMGDGPEARSPAFSLGRYWQHSLAVARLCQELAGRADPASSGVAYLAGLCHELGAIVFHSVFAAEYQSIRARHDQSAEPMAQLESRILGATRAELETAVIQALHLPDAVRGAILAAHGGRTPSASDGTIAQALACADLMATGLLLATDRAAPVRPLTRRMLPATETGAAYTLPDKESFAAEIQSLTATLARLSTDEQEELTTALFPRSEARVWLARSPQYAEYDPVAAALNAVASVRVETRLPLPQELAQVETLIVLTSGRPAERPFNLLDVPALLKTPSQPLPRTLCLVEPALLPKVQDVRHPALTIQPCLIPLDRLIDFVQSSRPAAAA